MCSLIGFLNRKWLPRRHFVILAGGLGNQMFQYALALALRNRGLHVMMDVSLYNYAQMHNGYELERVFRIKEPLIDRKGFHLRWLRMLLNIKPKYLLSEDSLCYDEHYLTYPKRYLCGYWQNEMYFKEIENVIRRQFVFQDIDQKNISVAREMSKFNSVSIHIRRGDYITSGMLVLEENYYEHAIRIIIEKVENPVFYIFSDDSQEGVSMASKFCSEYKVIDWNKGLDSYKDMYLMSQCCHHILANSSFSWWGAWLNNCKDGVVVAPREWTPGLEGVCPQLDSWILL